MVPAAVRTAAPQRVGAEGQGPGVLPQGQLQGDVPHHRELPGTNCIKIGLPQGLPGKLILNKRKGLREVLFS